ncbi:hypothetical protein LTR37_005068 [Vermiconidia calcicola]|uniref:Uncharacterized protein n=1 Tax=Vermiconidia calcicola TaxID=1690605 RepID=A0ACC3NKT5_9PEZI|nr:hypothetical protein LTR37_005068 [Vermiconidia calcicola]
MMHEGALKLRIGELAGGVAAEKTATLWCWQTRPPLSALFSFLFSQPLIIDNPILLVAHSLGGFLAKQALIAARRPWDDHDSLLSALHGLVLISSPRLRSNQRGEWQRAVGILLSVTRDVDKRLLEDGELQYLSGISDRFQDLIPQFRVLSTYETLPSKLKKSISINSRISDRVILVNEHDVRTGDGQEAVIKIDATHVDTCYMKESSARQALINLIEHCVKAAPKDRQQDLRDTTSNRTFKEAIGMERRASSPILPAALDLSSEDNTEPQKTNLSRKDSGAKLVDHIRSVSMSETKRKDPKLPCSSRVPVISMEDFVPRKEMMQMIDDALVTPAADDDPSQVRYVALYGTGGIGKTSTALQYWNTRGEKYGARFWIRADTPEKITDGFGTIVVLLGLLDHSETQDRAFNRMVAIDWLKNPVKRWDTTNPRRDDLANWLTVFDNVDDSDILEEVWPVGGGGSIIVTSRNPTTAWRPEYAINRRNEGIQVEPFSQQEAANFLRRRAPAADRRRDRDAAAELAQRLDCLPFALRQMGDLIHRRQTTFRRFLEVYQNEADQGKAEKLHKTSVKQSSDYNFTLSTVWAIEGLHEKILSLLNVLALLDSDGINEEILMCGDWTSNDPLYPASIAEYEDAKAELSVRSLIENRNDDDTAGDQITLHRTVQDAVRAKMSPEQFHLAFETAVELLLRAWPVKGRIWHYPVDKWPYCEALALHLIKLHSRYGATNAATGHPGESTSFAQLLIHGGWYWYQRGAPEQAKRFFDTSETLLNNLSDASLLLEDVWMCQGCVATETNDRDSCMKYYDKLLESVLQRLPVPKDSEDYEKIATAYNEMGIAHMMCQRTKEARKHFEKARTPEASQEGIGPYSFGLYVCYRKPGPCTLAAGTPRARPRDPGGGLCRLQKATY